MGHRGRVARHGLDRPVAPSDRPGADRIRSRIGRGQGQRIRQAVQDERRTAQRQRRGRVRHRQREAGRAHAAGSVVGRDDHRRAGRPVRRHVGPGPGAVGILRDRAQRSRQRHDAILAGLIRPRARIAGRLAFRSRHRRLIGRHAGGTLTSATVIVIVSVVAGGAVADGERHLVAARPWASLGVQLNCRVAGSKLAPAGRPAGAVRQRVGRQVGVAGRDGERQRRQFVHRLGRRSAASTGGRVHFVDRDRDRLRRRSARAVADRERHLVAARALRFARRPAERPRRRVERRPGRQAAGAVRQRVGRQVGDRWPRP